PIASTSTTAVVATVAGASSSSSPTTTDPTRAAMPTVTHPEVTDDRALLVGDSITESIGPRYSGAGCPALQPLGWNVTVDAFMGRTTAEAVQSLRAHLSSVGQVIVILIGHNDAVDPTSYRAQVTRLLDLVPHVPRVLLLTNYEFERGRDRMNQ